MIRSHLIILFSRQAFSIIVSTGRVVRYVRAELSATGRAVHGPSCPRAELSGYPICIYSNKAIDEYGIAAEHIKYAQESLVSPLTSLFNQIIHEGEIPNIFKTGYITPVHKKGKDVKSIGNYRGITVASIFGKIFEKLLLLRLTTMNSQQSNLQFGFTKESTPAMAALLVSEATLDSKATNSPLFLATLDSQKAFDVVNHHIMLDKTISHWC